MQYAHRYMHLHGQMRKFQMCPEKAEFENDLHSYSKKKKMDNSK